MTRWLSGEYYVGRCLRALGRRLHRLPSLAAQSALSTHVLISALDRSRVPVRQTTAGSRVSVRKHLGPLQPVPPCTG